MDKKRKIGTGTIGLAAALGAAAAIAAVPNSYAPVDDRETFEAVKTRMEKNRSAVESRFKKLIGERYDLSDNPVEGLSSSGRNKPIQGGVRVKLPSDVTWQQLSTMSPDDIKSKGLWPAGFFPLPHENQAEGGMLFPQFHIDKMREQDNRDLARFDLAYQLPVHFLPEYPPAIYLTTRPDLGDVSKGQVVTLQNYYELFTGILNPKQLDGLRLLVTPFMQQQFNATTDRRSIKPSMGVTCFDCHVNGHTNAATHLVGDIRPQEHRHRIDTPTLRGVNIQRLFGSQRALKTVEDFTEFEQRAAYFDGDPVIATKKGVNILDVFGKLDPAKASEQELRGQEVFFGKGQCASCHTPPYYTDNLMHNLKTERFFKETDIAGRLASADGPIKTFPLRGIKDSPPYLHDGRLLTLEDTVEFFNLVLGVKLTDDEKTDLVVFLRTL